MKQSGQTYNYSEHIINEALAKGDALFYLKTDHLMIACKYQSAKDKAIRP